MVTTFAEDLNGKPNLPVFDKLTTNAIANMDHNYFGSNYEENLKEIFKTYQISLGAQGELRRLFEEAIKKDRSEAWLEGFGLGSEPDWS